jgi:hypothetical protein
MAYTEFQIVSHLLPMISKGRFKSYGEWKIIGNALHTTFNGGDDGLKIWKDYSIKHESDFNEEMCIKEYSKNISQTITWKTIAHFAFIDNPTKYEIWHFSWVNTHLDSIFESPTPQNIINFLICYLYSDYIRCGTKFYRFHEGIWDTKDQISTIRNKITDEIKPEVLERCSDKVIPKKLMTFLTNSSEKTKVLRHFPETNFFRDDVIGLSNGTIVFEKDRESFYIRPSVPEDYIFTKIKCKPNKCQYTDEDLSDFLSKLPLSSDLCIFEKMLLYTGKIICNLGDLNNFVMKNNSLLKEIPFPFRKDYIDFLLDILNDFISKPNKHHILLSLIDDGTEVEYSKDLINYIKDGSDVFVYLSLFFEINGAIS